MLEKREKKDRNRWNKWKSYSIIKRYRREKDAKKEDKERARKEVKQKVWTPQRTYFPKTLQPLSHACKAEVSPVTPVCLGVALLYRCSGGTSLGTQAETEDTSYSTSVVLLKSEVLDLIHRLSTKCKVSVTNVSSLVWLMMLHCVFFLSLLGFMWKFRAKKMCITSKNENQPLVFRGFIIIVITKVDSWFGNQQ